MKPPSARSMLVVACAMLAVAGMIGSPEGKLFAAGVGALCALPALFVGTRGMKAGATVLLFVLGALAWCALPLAKGSMNAYRDRAHKVGEVAPPGTAEAK